MSTSTPTAARSFKVLPGKPGRREKAAFDPANPPVPRRVNGTMVSYGPWALRDVQNPEGSGLIVQRPEFCPSLGEAPELEVLSQDWPHPRYRTHELEALRRLVRISAAQRFQDYRVDAPEALGGEFFASKRLVAEIKAARVQETGSVDGWRSMLAPILGRFLAGDWGGFGSVATTSQPSELDRLVKPCLPIGSVNLMTIEDGAGAIEGAYRLAWTHRFAPAGFDLRVLRVVNPPKPLPDGIGLAAYLADEIDAAWSTS